MSVNSEEYSIFLKKNFAFLNLQYVYKSKKKFSY